MKKQNIYERYQKYVRDKDRAVTSFMENALIKTQSMFVYDGLPDSLPANELEKLLQVNGDCFITKVKGKLYALNGSKGGETDAYYRPTKYTVANPYLNLNETYEIGKDGILMENDSYGSGLLPVIGRYAVLYTDGVISLNVVSVMSRITMLISASDDKTKQSADDFVAKILDGDFSVIGENAFFKGVQMQSTPTGNSAQITQLIELVQFYKAGLLNELGLNANFNMKRERLNTAEVDMNIDGLLPFIDNMLTTRKKAVQAINEMFGTDIAVSLGSAWAGHSENDADSPADEPEPENGIDVPTDDETPADDTETDETEETKETDGNDAETDETKETDEKERDKDDEI